MDNVIIKDKYGFSIEISDDVIKFLQTQHVLVLNDNTKYYKMKSIIKENPDGTFEIFHDEWDFVIQNKK